MKWLFLSFLITAATPLAAECQWADDGQMATALADSKWQITSQNGISIERKNRTYNASLVAKIDNLVLSIGPLLRGNKLGEKDVNLSLNNPENVEDAVLKAGGNSFILPFPPLEGTACETSDLSAIFFNTYDGRLGTWMTLRAANSQRLIGVLKTDSTTSADDTGEGIFIIEATPLP